MTVFITALGILIGLAIVGSAIVIVWTVVVVTRGIDAMARPPCSVDPHPDRHAAAVSLARRSPWTIEDISALRVAADANERGWTGAIAHDESALTVAIAERLESEGYLTSQFMDVAHDSEVCKDDPDTPGLGYELTELGRTALAKDDQP